MLFRDLKRVANECCFNPNKPTKDQRILLDVGNPAYWTVKAMELIKQAHNLVEGSVAYKACLKEATTLLILSRAFLDDKTEKTKKSKKTGKHTSGQDSSVSETS